MTESVDVRSDGELLRAYVKSGDEKPFRILVERHMGMVSAAAKGAVFEANLAEDAVQATFVLLHQKAKKLQKRESLAGWLFETAKLVGLNMRRAEARRARWEEKAAKEREDSIEMKELEEENSELVVAISGLSGADREAVLLRYVQDLSYAEVGARMGLKEDTARMKCQRAIGKMRKFLKGKEASAVVVGLGQIGQVGSRGVGVEGVMGAVRTGGGTASAVSSVVAMVKTFWLIRSVLFGLIGAVVIGASGFGIAQLAEKNGNAFSFINRQDPVLAAMVGEWEGELEYANYGDDSRETVQVRSMIEWTNDRTGLKITYRYPGFDQSWPQPFVLAFNEETGEGMLSDVPGRHRVEGLEDFKRTGKGVVEMFGTIREQVSGQGLQNVPVRHTITVTENSLVIRRDTRDPWEFRNEHRFTRVR